MKQARIRGFEGIRAYAVCLVFLVHFLSHYFNGRTGPRQIDFDAYDVTKPAGLVESIAHYFWASHYGVDLFFLLSGFLIFRIISSSDFSYWRFLRDRFARLYPAFFVAVVVYLLYMAKFWDKTFDWRTIASNLLLLNGVWELRIEPIIVPTWSLTFEWLFYILFPAVLLLPGARARVSIRHMALCALLLLAIVLPLGPGYVRFFMFLLGAAFASVSAETIRNWAAQIPDWLAILLYVCGNLVFATDQNWRMFIPIFLVSSSVFVAKVAYGDGVLHRFFCLNALRWIGDISYSFYLFHGLAIVVFCDRVGRYLNGLPELQRFGALLAGSFALSIAIALISYRLFEKPYFDRKHGANTTANRNKTEREKAFLLASWR
jgi:exopolysaccharide production protein ExoZ